MDVLAAVFDKRLAKHLGKAINPFRVSLSTQFAPSQCSLPAQEASSGKKKHQVRKKKQPSIAETLSTR